MQAYIFDLDNTLYPSNSRLFDQIDEKMTQYVKDLLNLETDTARTLQKQYFHEHGTTLNGLMENHGIDPYHFLDFVHDIDMSVVPKDPKLYGAIDKLPGKKVIFTNGSVKHAENVLGYLGLADLFEGIFDIVATQFRPKPALDPYHDMLKKFGITASKSHMFEDMPRNLQPAAQLGITTVWLKTDTEYAGMHCPKGTPMKEYIHHVTEDLTSWLEEHLDDIKQKERIKP